MRPDQLGPVLERAAPDRCGVRDLGDPLRQLHYRARLLTPELGYPEIRRVRLRKRSSELTAEARHARATSRLSQVTTTRSVFVPPWRNASPGEAPPGDQAVAYRLDRTEGQAIVPVLSSARRRPWSRSWTTGLAIRSGISIVALRGYSSESHERDIRHHLTLRVAGRRYAGALPGRLHDPSGMDIERNARRYLGASFDSWEPGSRSPPR